MKLTIIIALILYSLCGFSQVDSTTVKRADGEAFSATLGHGVSVTDYGAIPDDDLEDSTAFKNAIATGKPVYIPSGVFNVNAQLLINDGQVIYGIGRQSVIKIDSLKSIFKLGDSSTVHGIRFKGTVGAGTLPVGVFTTQNGIWINGNANNIYDCWFSDLEAGIMGWNGINVYNNRVSNCNAQYCTIGFFYVSAFDYNITSHCDANYCTVGFYEFSSSNNRWVDITGTYNQDGFRLIGNGDHGTLASSTMNHNDVNLNLQSVTYSYIISDCNFFAGAIQFGGTDTVKNVTIDNCVFQDATISGDKTLNTLIRSPNFRHDVTITAANLLVQNARTDSPSDSPSEPYYPNVTTGTAAPGTTPIRNGDFFIDYTNKNIYFSTGTSSSADWSTVSGGSSLFPTTGTGTATGNVVGFTDSYSLLISDNSYSGGLAYFGGSQVVLGDIDGGVNNTRFIINDASQTITVQNGSTGVFKTSSLADTSNYVNESYTSKAYVDDHIANAGGGGGWALTGTTTVTDPVIDAASSTLILKSSSKALELSGGNFGFNVDPTSIGFLVTIKGTGTTGSTIPFMVKNSSSENLFYVDDNGSVFVGRAVSVSNMNLNARLAVGTSSNPVASAVAEFVSTTQGILPPRMTATQASAISSPAEGLVVYVTNTNGTFTTKGWWGYNGAAWQQF